jgi:predicted dehydrogenase
MSDRVRVAIYGCGRWANRTHIPNLQKIEGVEVVALCDIDSQALQSTAQRFGVAQTYRDGHAMLDREQIDVLFSIVRARVRTDVEAQAAEKGIHLFSEKPQAETMAVARQIDTAVQRGGVISTVGVRERYRPLFQRARQHLAGREITHVQFQSLYRGYAPPALGPNASIQARDLPDEMAMSWGVHAVDCIRFVTGLEVMQAQGSHFQPDRYILPIAQSFHFGLSNGAAATVTFVDVCADQPVALPAFHIYYVGGWLANRRRDQFAWSMAVDGGEPCQDRTDPWFEQDRLFIQAIRSGDRGLLLNDYHDGLYSLAPVLAARQSARRGGACIDVEAFMELGPSRSTLSLPT